MDTEDGRYLSATPIADAEQARQLEEMIERRQLRTAERNEPRHLHLPVTRGMWDLLCDLATDGLHGEGVYAPKASRELDVAQLQQVERDAVEKVAAELLRAAVRERFERAG